VGIRFISFRNEQAAAYGASAVGYLTGHPAALLTVSGPGVVHGLAGLANAQINTWPVVMLSGSTATSNVGKGGFQELDQLKATSLFVKAALRPEGGAKGIPATVAQAVRTAMEGRPGAVYIDLPCNFLHEKVRISYTAALAS
jgi:2-hydroxyacyl-CoA lyase 1